MSSSELPIGLDPNLHIGHPPRTCGNRCRPNTAAPRASTSRRCRPRRAGGSASSGASTRRCSWPASGCSSLILLAWHYAVEQEWLERIFTATPKEVWDGLVDIVGTQLFWEDTLVTLREAVLGFVIGGALGLLVGLLAGRYDARSARCSARSSCSPTPCPRSPWRRSCCCGSVSASPPRSCSRRSSCSSSCRCRPRPPWG